MPGRKPKPREGENRESMLDKLRAQVERYRSVGAREESEQRTGQRAVRDDGE
jgi:hypothetical protein